MKETVFLVKFKHERYNFDLTFEGEIRIVQMHVRAMNMTILYRNISIL